ncbi:HAMP domain-containing sensor histidine kinase [Pseudochrobactrum sp. AO18b]|uniref:sensor histidine kinase n=1 Tax=Pseudochrobactrum sp. AO18b TaxID=1201036 RepID=UPI00039A12A8|nr:HAMP domain-containing sensor histidine kinase [Pseudochrobactrum sp. AO18b]
MMSRLSALLSTTAVRLSALYLLLFLLSAMALFFYMTNLSVNFLTAQTQKALLDEVTSVTQSYERGGIPLLVRTIDRRSRQPGAFLYLISDPAGRILSGNVESLEPGVLDISGMSDRPFTYMRYGEQGNAEKHKAIAIVFAIPNGMRVLIGRDLSEPELFRDIMRRALVLALGIMGIGAFLIWYFVGRRALLRLKQVSSSSQRIMAGDLGERLPVSGSGDEFDRLSINLNAMLGRIEELNDGLKHVSDNIAHDLKTPLTRLRNKAEATLSGQKENTEYRAALEDIIAESDQLIRTFNAILMISRLEAGYSSENMEVLPVNPILHDVAELYEPVAEDAGLELVVEAGADISLRINRELVGQTISNLIDNAIKYSPVADEGGENRTKITVAMKQEGDQILISVADQGAGIPEAMREQATERFVRLEESRTQPGSGLGLSLAKAVMKLHGGSLMLEDNSPGLRVVLAFPALPETKQ